MHVCFSVQKDCENLYDSYGEICVGCNCCGRINKDTKLQCQLELNKRRLKEEHDFDNWIDGSEEEQKKNIALNITYFQAKIAEIEKLIKEGATNDS